MKKKTPSPQHQAFQKELSALQDRLGDLRQYSQELALQKPNPDDFMEGVQHRRAVQAVQEEQTQVRGRMSRIREEFICMEHHTTKRASKELPVFFKFCLFKNKPRRVLMQDQEGEFIRPIHETVNFRGVQAEVSYFRGELGDPDRMVYLAILNEAIQHKEFVWEFGHIPFSTEELAEKAGFDGASHQRREWVVDALRRLSCTQITFHNGLSPTSPFLETSFHLVEAAHSFGRAKLEEEVDAQVQHVKQSLKPRSYLRHLEEPDAVLKYIERLGEQARDLFEKFKIRTPTITLVKFNDPLMRAINGNEITTIDLWSLKTLTRNSARSLFLYLYDISQWRKSNAPLKLTLKELLEVTDLHPIVDHQNGKDYPRWNRTRELVEDVLLEVGKLLKCIDSHRWLGEEEKSVLELTLSDKVLQIPPR